jgi:hypothetical protein
VREATGFAIGGVPPGRPQEPAGRADRRCVVGIGGNMGRCRDASRRGQAHVR